METTKIEALRQYQEGCVIELPKFGEGQDFVAKLRRPSMLVLMASGKIPNSLIATASKLFNAREVDLTKESSVKEALDVLNIVAKAALIEPTKEELDEAGIELTDEQLLAIYAYTQRGIDAVSSFRSKQESN